MQSTRATSFIVFALCASVVSTGAISPSAARADDPAHVSWVRVRTVEGSADRFAFDACGNTDDRSCRVIGRESGYTERELKKVRASLRLRGGGVIVADAAIVLGIAAAVAFGGYVAVGVGASAVGAAGSTAISAGGAGALVTGISAGAVGAWFVARGRALNPRYRFRLAKALKNLEQSETSEHSEYLRLNGDATYFAHQLEKALERLE